MLTRAAAIAATVLLTLLAALGSAAAQKQGGTLRIYHRDNPPSASLHEEATVSVTQPFMAVFNNLVLFDQTKPLNSPETIVPELGESWSWDATNTKLTFKLRAGVKWHDGKPFSAKDVQCTWHALIGKGGQEEFNRNPRKVWYYNLQEVTTDGDLEATFHLGHPQPSFLMLLASGFSPVYPCHVSQRDMRIKPDRHRTLQAGRAAAQRRHQVRAQSRLLEEGQALRRCHRDAHHRKPLDAHPGLRVGRVRHDLRPRRHRAADEGRESPGAAGRLPARPHQRQHQPGRQLRRSAVRQPADPQSHGAGARSQGLHRYPHRGRGEDRRRHAAGPRGPVGVPPEELARLPGYGADIAGNLAEAQKIMAGLGYGPGKPLKVKVSVRNISIYRDPAVILIDQLKKIHIQGELEAIDTTVWYAKVQRRDYSVSLNLTGVAVDDPDVNLIENYTCKSERNYTQYCNPEVDALIFKQSQEIDAAQAQAAGVGGRAQARRGRGAAHHLPQPRRNLLASPRQGCRPAPEQHL